MYNINSIMLYKILILTNNIYGFTLKLLYLFVEVDDMYKRKFLMLLVISLVVISTTSIAFAQSDSIKTHEYNFLNKAFFNISDDLTNETEFKLSPFDSLEVGTYYPYPD